MNMLYELLHGFYNTFLKRRIRGNWLEKNIYYPIIKGIWKVTVYINLQYYVFNKFKLSELLIEYAKILEMFTNFIDIDFRHIDPYNKFYPILISKDEEGNFTSLKYLSILTTEMFVDISLKKFPEQDNYQIELKINSEKNSIQFFYTEDRRSLDLKKLTLQNLVDKTLKSIIYYNLKKIMYTTVDEL